MSQSSGSSGDPPDDERLRGNLDERVQDHVTGNLVSVDISPCSLVTPNSENAEPVQQNVSTPTPNPSNTNLQQSTEPVLQQPSEPVQPFLPRFHTSTASIGPEYQPLYINPTGQFSQGTPEGYTGTEPVQPMDMSEPVWSHMTLTAATSA